MIENPIRLIVSDIDGTLVRHDKTLPDANVAAIARARALGIKVSLISARPPSGMAWIARRLGLDGPLAAFNGATIFVADGPANDPGNGAANTTIIEAHHLDRDIAMQALALIERPGVSPWLFADGQWHARDRLSPRVAREIQSAGLEPRIGGEWAALLGRTDKIVGVCEDPDLLVGVERELIAALGEDASIARSQPYFLDVLDPAGNKGRGIARLAVDYGVSLAEVAALGDQNNDLPMFRVAGLSVAMAQGPDNVRAAAMHVAASNDDNGVADAIERFVLADR